MVHQIPQGHHLMSVYFCFKLTQHNTHTHIPYGDCRYRTCVIYNEPSSVLLCRKEYGRRLADFVAAACTTRLQTDEEISSSFAHSFCLLLCVCVCGWMDVDVARFVIRIVDEGAAQSDVVRFVCVIRTCVLCLFCGEIKLYLRLCVG